MWSWLEVVVGRTKQLDLHVAPRILLIKSSAASLHHYNFTASYVAQENLMNTLGVYYDGPKVTRPSQCHSIAAYCVDMHGATGVCSGMDAHQCEEGLC